MSVDTTDAVVIGAGPNGLTAAAFLARKGWDVTVLETADVPGGAIRSEQLTAPGYVHDTFSAFYGLLHSTPVFELLDLGTRVQWARFESPVGALLGPDDGAFIFDEVDRTTEMLAKIDPADGDAWRALCEWWGRVGRHFFAVTLAPIPSARPSLRFARAAGIRGSLETLRMLLGAASGAARDRFRSQEGQMLLASGLSHTDLGVDMPASAPQAVILAMLAQFGNMPVPVGGASALAEGWASAVTDAGGVIRCGERVTRVILDRRRAYGVETASGAVVRARHAVLADTGAPALFRDLVGEDHLPSRFLDGLRRFRYGTGMFKLDVALDGPAPWRAEGAERCGVVHLTGRMTDMARASFEAHHGLLPSRPVLIVGQQSIADPSRAPAGCHTLWVETHVPPHPIGDGASERTFDGWEDAADVFADRMLELLEQHAPGLRARIVGTAVHTPVDLERKDANLVGGDVGGGSNALDMQLVFRPVPGWFRYRTPIRGLYLASASAHPGGGVHGMSGLNAAKRALRDARRPAGMLRTASGARRAPR